MKKIPCPCCVTVFGTVVGSFRGAKPGTTELELRCPECKLWWTDAVKDVNPHKRRPKLRDILTAVAPQSDEKPQVA